MAPMSKKATLSRSTIVGLVLGCAVLVAVVIIVSVLVYRRSIERLREEAMFAELFYREAANKQGRLGASDAAYTEM